MLFPPGQPVRVPIVAITGTNGKTTTTRMIAHIMHTAGKTVGMTSTDGIDIAGTRIARGDRSGPTSARKVLRNPMVECAVLETARGGILRSGLGFAQCDVAVVTNVADDHLGLRGIDTLEDLARVKAVVPRAVAPEGASVLNADDALTAAMAADAGGEILYFSLAADNPLVVQHLQRGGRALVLASTPQGEELQLRAGSETTPLLPVGEIPATLEGRIRVNIANALAAAAAAIALQVPLATLRQGLRTFATSYAQNPGRFNLLELDGRQVMVDYCHNVHGLQAVIDVVRRLNPPHTVAAITMTGDRSDEHITAFGTLAAQSFDALVIGDPGPKYRRGRKRGEVAALLQDAALAAGLPAEAISVIPYSKEEVEDGTRVALDMCRPGGLVLSMIDDTDVAWRALTTLSKTNGSRTA
jgi:cyanophycin synthetase